MKKVWEEPSTYVLIYFLCMMITFGDAYHRVPSEEVGKFAGQEFIIQNGIGFKTFSAGIASIFWPLYWSVQAQRK